MSTCNRKVTLICMGELVVAPNGLRYCNGCGRVEKKRPNRRKPGGRK